jgi:hypothetical protein
VPRRGTFYKPAFRQNYTRPFRGRFNNRRPFRPYNRGRGGGGGRFFYNKRRFSRFVINAYLYYYKNILAGKNQCFVLISQHFAL